VHVMTGRGPALAADASAAWIDNHALLVEREEP